MDGMEGNTFKILIAGAGKPSPATRKDKLNGNHTGITGLLIAQGLKKACQFNAV
jgi:hypothetical protein